MTRNTLWNSIEAQRVLGLLAEEAAVKFAETAISEDCDLPALIELAGLSSPEYSSALSLLDEVLSQAGRGQMTKSDALRQYAQDISRIMLGGEVSPIEGAKRIWQATLSADLDDFHDLDGFIYAASEADDRPAEMKTFEKAILEEARNCLA